MQGVQKVKRLEFIDSLRGWAVLAVIIVHANALVFERLPVQLQIISSSGARGVQLFFILSAFSLFYSLDRREQRGLPENIVTFTLRRYFRIAPMFYLAIAVYGMGMLSSLYPWLYGETQYSIGNILAHVSFIHGFWPNYVNSLVPGGWSIATEMAFYMIVPLLFWKIKTISNAIWFFIASLIIYIGMSLVGVGPPFFSPSTWTDFVFFLLPSQLVAFSLGILLYMFFQRENNHTNGKYFSLNQHADQLMVVGILGVIIMFLNGQYRGVLFSLPLFFIVLSLSLKGRKLFVNRYLSFFGKISFSVYLLHFLLIPFVSKFVLSALPPPISGIEASVLYIEIVAITIMLILPLAYGTYSFIERPGMMLGEYVIRAISRNSEV